MKNKIISLVTVLALSVVIVGLTACGKKDEKGITGKYQMSSFAVTYDFDSTDCPFNLVNMIDNAETYYPASEYMYMEFIYDETEKARKYKFDGNFLYMVPVGAAEFNNYEIYSYLWNHLDEEKPFESNSVSGKIVDNMKNLHTKHAYTISVNADATVFTVSLAYDGYPVYTAEYTKVQAQ
jgi:hypothetical protein